MLSSQRLVFFDRYFPLRRQSSLPSADHVCRGILIVLIVLGHIEIFRTNFFPAYSALYNFHVQAFLILPFIREKHVSVQRSVASSIWFYYKPFVIFVAVYFAAFCAYTYEDASPGDWMLRFLRAVTLANSVSLDQATGFELFWFLPTFILLMLVRRIWTGAEAASRLLILVAAAAAHLFAALWLRPHVVWLPWGLPILLYMLLPCLIASYLGGPEVGRRWRVVASGVLFALCLSLCVVLKLRINLSDYQVYDAFSPGALLITDITMIAGALFIYGISHWIRSRLVGLIGSYSLQIYLIHGIVAFALVAAVKPFDLPPLLGVVLSFGAVMAVSLLASFGLMASPVGKWIFATHGPRGTVPSLAQESPSTV
jgi:fucose 4-O-acetylase-like acetyltransferase